VVAFDVGPANTLLDGVIALATGGRERFDRDGRRASAGRANVDWLEELLADPYLERPPPKSTGRERYGLAQARALLERAERERVGLDDLVATLVEASTRAIARAWRELASGAGGAGRLLVGGGGARNPAVMKALARQLEGVIVEPMDRAGVPADAAEAMAFSLLGRNALLGLPNQLPQCTGVAEARVLGVVHPAGSRPARA
jgi:anhydro-N-acetylmuramic acid kinase